MQLVWESQSWHTRWEPGPLHHQRHRHPFHVPGTGRVLGAHCFSECPEHPCKADIGAHDLQLRTQRLREMKQPARGHTARLWWNQDWNPAPKPVSIPQAQKGSWWVGSRDRVPEALRWPCHFPAVRLGASGSTLPGAQFPPPPTGKDETACPVAVRMAVRLTEDARKGESSARCPQRNATSRWRHGVRPIPRLPAPRPSLPDSGASGTPSSTRAAP